MPHRRRLGASTDVIAAEREAREPKSIITVRRRRTCHTSLTRSLGRGQEFDNATNFGAGFVVHSPPINERVRLSSITLCANLYMSAVSIGPAAATQLGRDPGSSVSTMGTPSGGCTANPISVTSSVALFKAPPVPGTDVDRV